MNNTPDPPAQTPDDRTDQGGNYWTLFTPGIWKHLHAVLQRLVQKLGLSSVVLHSTGSETSTVIDRLQDLVTVGHVGSILLGEGNLHLTTAQFVRNRQALSLIRREQFDYKVSIALDGSPSEVSAILDRVQDVYSGGYLGNIFLQQPGNLRLTAAQIRRDAQTLRETIGVGSDRKFGVDLLGSATDVLSVLDVLQNPIFVGYLGQIRLVETNRLLVTAEQADRDRDVLNLIRQAPEVTVHIVAGLARGPGGLVWVGSVSDFSAEFDNLRELVQGLGLSSLTLRAVGAETSTIVDKLQDLAAVGRIGSIVLDGGGNLKLATAQITRDGEALRLMSNIAGDHKVSIDLDGSPTEVASVLDRLQDIYARGNIGNVVLQRPGNLRLTAAQVRRDAQTLRETMNVAGDHKFGIDLLGTSAEVLSVLDVLQDRVFPGYLGQLRPVEITRVFVTTEQLTRAAGVLNLITQWPGITIHEVAGLGQTINGLTWAGSLLDFNAQFDSLKDLVKGPGLSLLTLRASGSETSTVADKLQDLVAGGHIGGIILDGNGSLRLATTQIVRNGLALSLMSKIAGDHKIGIDLDGTATQIASVLDRLQSLMTAGHVGTVRYGVGGNDSYIVGPGDTVAEMAGGGTDTVQSSLIDLTLANYPNVENVQLTGITALKATGDAASNVLDGSTSSAANVLTGLGGNDIYIVGSGDTIVEAVGGGTDTVQSSLINLMLASYLNVENVRLTGAVALKATGDIGNNLLDGSTNTAANVLTGLGGSDTYIVGAGDTIVEAAGAAGGKDTVQSSLISLVLSSYLNVENAKLAGAIALSATGDVRNNVLDGSTNTAANVLTGLGGNDIYIVGTGDTVVEAVGGGTDTVQSSLINLTLANYLNVENVGLTGAIALTATGDAGNNVLDGSTNTAANLLTGLGGNDTYIVGAGDTIVEAEAGGTDTVQSSLIHLTLANYLNVENVGLTGAVALKATGNAGNNVLDGSMNTASNVLIGLAGNDTYVVGAGDTIVEAVGGGTDRVQSSLISLTLANYLNVESVKLTGSVALNATGNNDNNVLDGSTNTAANVLTGLGGNDTYIVGTGDTIVEVAGAGTDTVLATVDYGLAAGVAVEFLRNGAGATGLTLTGNELRNTIIGGDGNDILIGNGGLDILTGGTGVDRFQFLLTSDSVVDANRDVISDFFSSQGDLIDLSAIDANDLLPGDQAFSFLGVGPFTGGHGEVRYAVTGADAVIQGSITGTGVDFEIKVPNVVTFTGADFRL